MGIEKNNLSPTEEYKESLKLLYSKFIRLSPEESTYSSKNKISHRCLLCGFETHALASTMLNDNGCGGCKTTSFNYLALADHLDNLCNSKGNYILDTYPVKFNLKSRYIYKCRTCNSQCMLFPKEALTRTKCYECNSGDRHSRSTHRKDYVDRLQAIYGTSIYLYGEFSIKYQTMLHKCKANHTWDASMVSMLTGHGCPVCKSSVDVTKCKPFTAYRKKIITRNLTEKEALPLLRAELGTLTGLHLALSFPIPRISGKHVPSFYSKSKNLLIDVVSASKYSARLERLMLYSIRARNLGYDYAIVVLADIGKTVEGKQSNIESQMDRKARIMYTSKWFLGESVPEGFLQLLSRHGKDSITSKVETQVY